MHITTISPALIIYWYEYQFQEIKRISVLNENGKYLMSIYIYINLPEKPSLLSGCIPMSNPIKVSEEAADHVQEVNATHSHLPS